MSATTQDMKNLGYHIDKNGVARKLAKMGEAPKKTKKVIKNEPKGKVFIEGVLKLKKLNYEKETLGIKNRKFRFDFSVPSMNLAIEYNGIFSDKSRHTTCTGYTNDMTKINLAQLNGWMILQYTPLNYKDFLIDIEQLLGQI